MGRSLKWKRQKGVGTVGERNQAPRPRLEQAFCQGVLLSLAFNCWRPCLGGNELICRRLRSECEEFREGRF